MKWRLKILALCIAASLAAHLMAQDTGGGAAGGGGAGGASGGGGDATGGGGDAGGTAMPDNSGLPTGTTNPDNGGGSGGMGAPDNGNTNGNPNGTNGNPNGTGNSNDNGLNGGTGNEGSNGNTTPGTNGNGTEGNGTQGNGTQPATGGGGEILSPGTGTQGGGEGTNPILPPLPSLFPPGTAVPLPGATPAPSPIAPVNQGTAGAAALQQAPVTFTLPGGYGGNAATSLTLGQGRLAKPVVTLSTSVSQGYDTNVFSADSHIVAVPTPTPSPTPEPPLEHKLVGYNITPPYPPVPVYFTFRAPVQARPTPTPAKTLGVIGSPVTSVTIGAQVQHGSPRTVITLDLSLSAQDYYNEPGGGEDFSGSFDMSFVHRITPRATFSMEAFAVYQKTPDFALINAPTSAGTGGNYLNGDFKANLTYTWSERISTVTSYELALNLLQSNGNSDLYSSTYGTQFRYTVSPRNTLTAELRAGEGIYPTNSSADTSALYYLLGLDTTFSSKLSNTVSFGIEDQMSTSSGSQTLPYIESATTLGLPRGGALSWTNRYGAEEPPGVGFQVKSYRTGLTLSQPLSTKLVGSVSIAYNNVVTTDTAQSSGSYTQNQLQGSLSLAYTLSPRLSMSLSYTYIDLLTTQINSSYIRQQIYLGGSYQMQ